VASSASLPKSSSARRVFELRGTSPRDQAQSSDPVMPVPSRWFYSPQPRALKAEFYVEIILKTKLVNISIGFFHSFQK
jgi:hypothetical protein